MTYDVRAPLIEQLQEPARLRMAPKVPETSMRPHHVSSGLLALDDNFNPAEMNPHPDPTPHHSVAATGLVSGTGASASTMVFAAGSSSVPTPPIPAVPTVPTQQEFMGQLMLKRVAQNLPQNPREEKRARRTCRKCAIPYCKGSRGFDFCENKCRDCGKSGRDLSCIGRNPKFPNVICTKARWP